MNKRGQITLFVIIGVLIASAVILVYFLKPSILGISLSPEESQKLVTAQVQPIRDYTDGCMLTSAKRILNTMGRQGGYVIPRSGHFDIPSTMSDAPIINYALFYDSQRGYLNELPSVNALKDELANYLENSLDFAECINGYSSFKQLLDVNATFAAPKIDRANMEIGEKTGQIIIPYTFPAQISKGNASAYIENYELAVPINLARIRETSARIVNDAAVGKNYMEVVKEEGDREWSELRENPNAEKILMSAEAYTSIPSDVAGKIYDEKNLLFKLSYSNSNLDKPYDFYVLIGQA